MKSARWVITYIVVASLGLWAAFFMSLKFMTPGLAQTPEVGQAQRVEPPSPGDLPPEFVQDTQIPPPPTQPPVQQGAAATPQAVMPTVEAPPTMGAPTGTPPMVPSTMPGADSAPPHMEGAAPIIPQFASDEQYNYDPTGRRDPFKPYRIYRPSQTNTTTATTEPAKAIDESDPLQRWELDRFAVVAIMWEVRQPKAMVKDPDGKMFMIGKSTKIGRNSGHVVAIREGEVVVVEQIDNEGVQTKEVKILELKK